MPGFIDQVEVDFIANGQGEGELAQNVANGRYSLESDVGFDAGLLRPIIQSDGKKYCNICTGKTIVVNGVSTPERKHIPLQRLIANGTVSQTLNANALPYLAWQMIDRDVLIASQKRLQAWTDLEAVESFGGFDGMATYSIVRDTETDPGDAMVTMDKLGNDINDAPKYTPDILPLPIIHAGASISQRKLAVSRRAGMPLDTRMIRAAARRVAETLEKMTIGMTDFSTLTMGSSSDFSNRGIYGYRAQPERLMKTDNTSASTVDVDDFVVEVIDMIELARAQNFFGPFTLYYSNSYNTIMSKDYVTGAPAQGLAAPLQTVKQRLNQIEELSAVKSLDHFTSTDELLLVEMNSETIRAVNGMDFTTVQWEVDGGASTRLRVMAIKVPDLQSQFVNQSTTVRKCGIVHGTTS